MMKKHLVLILFMACISSVIAVFYTFVFSIDEEKQAEFDVNDGSYKLFDILPLNGSDYSNSTIKIDMSHVQEMKQDNGSLIIEIRKVIK